MTLPGLRPPSGCGPLRLLAQTGSTNDEAKDWASAGAPDGATVVADAQLAGRGRGGRSWHSPSGLNLYLSQVWRAASDRLRMAPLVGAVAARRAAARFLPPVCKPRIKWPNDVLGLGRKLVGILAEGTADGAAVIGLGVNLNATAADFPDGLRSPAASLRMLRGHQVDRSAFLDALLRELERARRLAALTPGRLLAEWRRECLTIGHRVRVTIPGAPPWSGLARDLSEDGALLVEDGSGNLHRIEAGDVDPAPNSLEGQP